MSRFFMQSLRELVDLAGMVGVDHWTPLMARALTEDGPVNVPLLVKASCGAVTQGGPAPLHFMRLLPDPDEPVGESLVRSDRMLIEPSCPLLTPSRRADTTDCCLWLAHGLPYLPGMRVQTTHGIPFIEQVDTYQANKGSALALEHARSAAVGSLTVDMQMMPGAPPLRRLYLSMGQGEIVALELHTTVPDSATLALMLANAVKQTDWHDSGMGASLKARSILARRRLNMAKAFGVAQGLELGDLYVSADDQQPLREACVQSDVGEGVFIVCGYDQDTPSSAILSVEQIIHAQIATELHNASVKPPVFKAPPEGSDDTHYLQQLMLAQVYDLKVGKHLGTITINPGAQSSVLTDAQITYDLSDGYFMVSAQVDGEPMQTPLSARHIAMSMAQGDTGQRPVSLYHYRNGR